MLKKIDVLKVQNCHPRLKCDHGEKKKRVKSQFRSVHSCQIEMNISRHLG